jgi:selenocysteine lyase/cysteine desulfurase
MMTLPNRAAFSIPDEIAYLNCAYQGPLSNEVAAVGRGAFERKATPWTIGANDFFDDLEHFRRALAALTGLDAEGFAVTPSVSYGVSIAARNLEFGPADEIVVLADQFPSNVYAWRECARRSGANLVTIERAGDGDFTGPLIEAIGPQTALVAAAPCHWTDGTRLDLHAISDALPERTKLLLDTAQSLGAVRLPLSEIAADVVVGVTYKWLLGPYSVGFAWFSPELREGQPIEFNWIARADSEDFAGLVDYKDGYRHGARRFDVGEVSNFALLPPALRAVQLITEWDPARIERHTAPLIDRAAAGATNIGCTPVSPALRSPHLTGLRLPAGADPSVVAQVLADRGVYVSVRGDSVRVSVHGFNTTGDVDRLLAALDAALGAAID